MPAKLQNEWRRTAIFTGLVFMMTAVFMTRAVLSVSVAVFVAISLLHTGSRKQLLYYFQNPLLWSMSLLFLVPLVSGIWSGDQENWKRLMLLKLPLLFLPLAFATPFDLQKRHWKILAWLFICLVAVGSAWSFIHYLQDPYRVTESYLRAKTLPTPLDNDYVRFGWITALASLLAGWLGSRAWKYEKLISVILLLISAWLIIYLHVLSSRTGVMTLYLGFFFALAISVSRRDQRAWLYLGLLVMLPLAAYFFIPSFQNRVKYLVYQFDFAKNAAYIPGSTDPVRVISYQAGIAQLAQDPLRGAGFGDLERETRSWYDRNYPGMREEDKILPSSEYLIYGAGAGLPGLLVFLFVLGLPFFMRTVKRPLWIFLHASVAAGFLFDIGLEVQYGVFLYCFMVLACWKWLETEKNQSLQ